MAINLDLVIFIGFLAINLAVGIFYGRGVKNIRQYAVGNQDFSTGTIAATIVATWIGGGFFSFYLKVYNEGLVYIILGLCELIPFLYMYFFAPRMGEFLGSLSVAEVMGKLYGEHVRIISAISGLARVTGTIAIQFKVSAMILSYFFEIPSLYTLLISASVITFYSAFGGIKAVTFTDIIQFFTFSVFLPVLALIIWGALDNPYIVIDTITENPIFDYKRIFNFNNPDLFNFLLLALLFLTPRFDPAMFQRIAIAKNIKQVRNSFMIATIILLIIMMFTWWIAILLLASNPSLEAEGLISHIINKYPYPVFRGLMLSGIIAMIMSTADSYINSAAVLSAHDILRPLGMKWAQDNELLLSRLLAIITSCAAIVLALVAKDILQIIMNMASFYVPIVIAPLVLSILGFRSTSKVALIGISAGTITVLTFYLFNIKLNSTIPAMTMNLIFFMGSHYVLNQPGGWVGIKDKKILIEIKKERKKKIRSFVDSVKQFNFLAFCRNNAPKQDYVYSLFGVFCIISVFSTMYSIPREIQHHYSEMLEFVYHIILIASTILLTYPIWPPTFKQEKFITVFWNISVPYILIFAPTLLIIISNFGQFQLMIFLLNIIIMAMLLKWQIVLIMVFVGVFTSIQFFKWFVGLDNLALDFGSLQFKIMYLLLLLSSILIAFLKPKQEYQELVEEKNEHLTDRIAFQDKFTKKHIALGNDFFQNIQHEYHAPMTAVISMAEVLYEKFDDFNAKALKKHIKTIYDGTIRLGHFDENITVLSKLVKAYEDVEIKALNLSKILVKSLEKCQKYYIQNPDDRQFEINIEDGLIIKGHDYYIEKVFDNLIINAINYCEKDRIAISLSKKDGTIEFVIEDDGKGIPKDELDDIFEPFTVSSRTYSAAEGRGLGLTLCKMIVELHVGEIHAYSDGIKGSKFIVRFPAR